MAPPCIRSGKGIARWRAVLGALAVFSAALADPARGSAYEEAQALRREGLELLERSRGPGGDAAAGSKAAIAKFEEALAKLEGASENTREGSLREDLNALIFWTRRTSPIDFSALPAPPPQAGAADASAGKDSQDAAAASAALERAELYASSDARDPVTVAARFFEVADRYKDVHDVAFKAIQRAQYFQRLAQEKEARAKAEAAFESLPPDEKLVILGDRAYASGNYEEAAAKYREALALKASPERHRKLGHAHFSRAQQLRDEYTKTYMRHWREFTEARKRNDRPAMDRAAAAGRSAGRIAKDAIEEYRKAETAFRAAWESAGRFDIDSEVHIALTHVVRKEKMHQDEARTIFERVLRTYADRLRTDEERTLYALAETYAGPEVVRKSREELARARSAGRAVAADDGRDPSGLSDAELRSLAEELRRSLAADEKKLEQKQSVGVLDTGLLGSINAARKRLAALEDELRRRGGSPP